MKTEDKRTQEKAINIKIPYDLHTKLKIKSAQSGMTMVEVIVNAIIKGL